jgi:hypothetical protein
MRQLFITVVVLVSVAGACATAGGGSPVDAGKKDSGGVGTDSSTDGPAPNDTGPGPDTGGNCVKSPPSNVCGVFPQCGCGTQQTCEVDQNALDGSSSCVQAGTIGVGGACNQTAGQCAPGLTCIWGECHAYCGTDGSQCTTPNTNYCVNLTDSNNQPIQNLLVCHNDCNLQDPSSCGGGTEGCVYFDVDTVDCYPVGGSTTCSASSSFCKPGDVCVYDGVSAYTCSPWCRIGLNDCTSGTCNPFSTPPTVNSQEYGYCQ